MREVAGPGAGTGRLPGRAPRAGPAPGSGIRPGVPAALGPGRLPWEQAAPRGSRALQCPPASSVYYTPGMTSRS